MASRENHKAQDQGPPTISQGEGDLQQLIAQTTAPLSPAGYSEKSISNYIKVDLADLHTIYACFVLNTIQVSRNLVLESSLNSMSR